MSHDDPDLTALHAKAADSATKQHQADDSGSFADQKAADAAYEDMIREARRVGLFDDPDEECL